MKSNNVILGVLILLGVLSFDTFFVLDPTEQAIVFQFGRPVKVVDKAGLQTKLPYIQDLAFFEKRLIDLDPPSQEVNLSDKKRLNVDVYARYRIINVLEFFKTLRTEAVASARFENIINSTVLEVLGSHALTDILSAKREDIMKQIQEEVNTSAKEFGVVFADVRISRAVLPKENTDAIEKRMISERDREAKYHRALGEEEKLKIMSRADRERVVILAKADAESNRIRGEGEAKATTLYAQVYGQAREFYDYFGSMELYKKAAQESTLILSPESEVLKYFFKVESK